MRKITKVLFGSAAVLATATLVQIATPATADAADATNPLAGKITVNAAEQTLTVDSEVLGAAEGKNRQIYFGIAKVSSKKEVTAPTKWDVYDTAGSSASDLVISLASLKNTADNYIQIKGSENADPVTILIPKAEKYRAEFNPVAAGGDTDKFFKVTEAKKVNGVYPGYTGSKVEIRTQYGDWSELTLDETNPFAAYQEQGATIYVRVPASSTTSLGDTSGVTYIQKKKKATDPNVEVTVKKAASFASAEFKVSVKKRADGPKVSVDFVKSTLSVPAGCKYRVVNVDALGTGAFIGAGDDDAVSATKVVKSLTDTVVRAGTTAMIEQKKAAVTTGKKAIESKVAQLKVTRPADPTIADATIADATISESSNSCVGGKVNDDVTITRSTDLKKLKFENSSDKVYQVYLKKNDVAVTDPKAGWKDIKAKKVTASATTNGTLSITLPTTNTEIWIRVKGDAKTATLSSNALELGKVKYDSTEAAAATANAKIADAVTALKNTTCPVTIKEDKSELILPTASASSGVSYAWESDTPATIDENGKLVSGLSATSAGTVNMTVTVSATGGTSKKVKFAVTVSANADGDGVEITAVATGVDA